MRLPGTLLIAVLFASPLVAQAPLVQRIDVSVVNIDVTVTDRAGNPVRGLTQKDFEIFEDDVPQKITNFYAVENIPARHVAPAEERFRRKVLIIVDNITTTRYNRDRALGRLESFIDEHFSSGEYEWSMALVDYRSQLLMAPTSDKQEIYRALGEIRKLVAGDMRRINANRIDADIDPVVPPTPAGGITTGDACNTQRLQGMLAESDRLQFSASDGSAIAALTQAMRAFSSVTGKKVILFLTSDSFLRTGLDPLSVTACMPAGMETRVTQEETARVRVSEFLMREANASNVSLYIINTEGLRAPEYVSMDHRGTGAGMTETFIPPTDNGQLYWLAKETGGRLLPGNRVEESLESFDASTSNFYSLGYRPQHPDDGAYHRLRVRIMKEGTYYLHYRDGYSSLPSESQLVRLLQSPLAPVMQSSTLPVSLAFGAPTAEEKSGALLVPISAGVPLQNLTFLPGSSAPVEIFFSLFDSNGRNIQLVRLDRQALPSGLQSHVEKHLLRLKKGQPYRVVVAIRDPLTEAFGIAEQRVKF